MNRSTLHAVCALIILYSQISCDRESDTFQIKDIHRENLKDKSTGPTNLKDNVFDLISGEWISYNGLAEITFDGNIASFQFEDDLLPFFELNGTSKVIKETILSFDHDNKKYTYDIYWVIGNPNKLVLSRKDIASGKYVQEHFIRLEVSEFREQMDPQ